MINPEVNAEIRERFFQKVGEELLKIYRDLSGYMAFSPDTLTHEKVDSTQGILGKLSEEAEGIGEKALSEILKTLDMGFYELHTVGTVDNPREFELKAETTFGMIETALLMMPSVSKQVLEDIEKRRERY